VLDAVPASDEQPHRVCDHCCKAPTKPLAYEEKPKAETETDINRPHDPEIHRPKTCRFGVIAEQAQPNAW
jgi:hypothetical protein